MEKINLSWLRKARRNRHLKLEQVAKAVGKDRSTLWRYESGDIPLNVDVLFQLLALYKVSIVDVTQKVEDEHESI